MPHPTPHPIDPQGPPGDGGAAIDPASQAIEPVLTTRPAVLWLEEEGAIDPVMWSQLGDRSSYAPSQPCQRRA